ncbi:MAG: isoleucine--tRNA ligase [Candidatus Komeilibacteria bacterium]
MINFSQEEEKILEFWKQDQTFAKSLKKDSPKGEYVFYDGPPFATGLPHYGHIVASLIKDVVPRYQTMKGFKVDRKWGWDCHGLPIENIVEKELELNVKKDIEEYGVDKFNEACRSKVMKYAEEWRKTIDRMGRWVDMDDDYKTMDKDYMESIWWVFKELWDKDLIYEGRRSMHVCPRCETTLSQSEVGQGYEDVEDISVTAKFELVDEPGTYILSWTTTPWTLPGNLAIAMGEDVKYIKVKLGDEKYIVAKEVAEFVFGDQKFEIIEEIKAKTLENKKYKPLFDYYANAELENKDKLFTIQLADFVNIEDGTGIVHIAPGFGEDDYNLSLAKKLPFIQHVDMSGRFTKEVKDFEGLEVKAKDDPTATDKKIIEYLKEKNLLFADYKYTHSYPHCWRCDSPLLNYTTSSWFVAVEKIKDKLLKKAEDINWVPNHLKEGRFGNWLEGARDWSVSRQRYWGSVIPIWICDSCEERKVFGSAEELAKESGQTVDDLHKHFVDQIEIKCRCGGTMKRIPDVLDCWFESGSMPYAQMHYPFENAKRFEQNFPAEFIAEGVDQTRAWFYYMHLLAVAIKKSHAYKNVVVNGIVLAEDGKKMSKKLRNYPDPQEMFDKYGADAIRYYLITSPVVKANDLKFSENDVNEIYRNLIMLTMNIVSFYKMYEGQGTLDDKLNDLDQWLQIKTQELINTVSKNMEAYKLVEASRPILEFINEFSTWYIRRSRDRFKNGSQSAIKTTRQTLEILARVAAPFTPFLAEWIYQQIRFTTSVHLTEWPIADKLSTKDETVLLKMKEVRIIVEKALAVRDEAGIKVRQPLQRLAIRSSLFKKDDTDYLELIKDEVNVKEVLVDVKMEKDVELDTKISEELKAEGYLRDLVRQINNLRKKAKLTISDRVEIYWQTDDDLLKKVIVDHQEFLMKQVLAIKIEEGEKDGIIKDNVKVGEVNVQLCLVN